MTLPAIDASDCGDTYGWDVITEGVEWRRRYEIGGQAIIASVRLRLFARREGGIWRATARVEDGWTYWGARFSFRARTPLSPRRKLPRGARRKTGGGCNGTAELAAGDCVRAWR